MVRLTVRQSPIMPNNRSTRKLTALMLALLFALFLPACQSEEPETPQYADYGTFGSKFALRLARTYPYRSPGSAQEKAAGDLIVTALEDMGYTPVVTRFSYSGLDGTYRTSRNISITIPGTGFVRSRADGSQETFRRQVIVGAHYDTFVSLQDVEAYRQTTEPAATPTPVPTRAPDDSGETTATTTTAASVPEPTLLDYDGIHDNASGIGALLILAREIRQVTPGYDVVLVAFGAGEDGQAGARKFAASMGKDKIALTDAMYCMDSIYAGDKIYAHAGRSSLRTYNRKSYEMRRKLYEVTDVFYEHELYTNNNYMLYTNQASIDLELEGISTPVMYREWTLNDSDYLPFDELGIQIVFFESYDYDGKELDDFKESKNPAFSETGGAIRHTPFDTTVYLNYITNRAVTARVSLSSNAAKQTVDQLTKRVNNTAFVILEAILKGVHDAQSVSEAVLSGTPAPSATPAP